MLPVAGSTDGRGPGDAVRRDVGEVDREQALPERLAGGRVERDQPLLPVRDVAGRARRGRRGCRRRPASSGCRSARARRGSRRPAAWPTAAPTWSGRPVSAERPSRFGPPRHSGQLSADGGGGQDGQDQRGGAARATASRCRGVTDVRVSRDAHRKLTDKMWEPPDDNRGSPHESTTTRRRRSR